MTMVAHIPGSFLRDASPKTANDADCMESRVRTMSRGYVKLTDVIPAAPPHASRLSGVRSAPGDDSTNYKDILFSVCQKAATVTTCDILTLL